MYYSNACVSRDSDWLLAGRPRCRSSSLGGVKFFTSPCRPDWLWGPPNPLCDEYRGSFPGVKAATV
jgi:hypothetical protein